MRHRHRHPVGNDVDGTETTTTDHTDAVSTEPEAGSWGRPRRSALIFLSAGALAMMGCEEESTQLLLAAPAVPDATVPVVASRMDLTRIADVAADGLVRELLGELPQEKATQASEAIEEFGATVLAAPGKSFQDLQAALQAVDAESDVEDAPEQSDAGIAHGVLDLYVDWSHVTLFGTEPRSAPSPR